MQDDKGTQLQKSTSEMIKLENMPANPRYTFGGFRQRQHTFSSPPSRSGSFSGVASTKARSQVHSPTASCYSYSSALQSMSSDERQARLDIASELGIHFKARSAMISEATGTVFVVTFFNCCQDDVKGVLPTEDLTPLQEELSIRWHIDPIDKLLTSFNSSADRGLDAATASKRLLVDGPNTLRPPKQNGKALITNHSLIFY